MPIASAGDPQYWSITGRRTPTFEEAGMARQIRWPWRRQPKPAPAWPTPQTGRPTWATEQQQILPAVEPVIRECRDWR